MPFNLGRMIWLLLPPLGQFQRIRTGYYVALALSPGAHDGTRDKQPLESRCWQCTMPPVPTQLWRLLANQAVVTC